MRFKINQSNITDWHIWFAWHPVSCGTHVIFLENVFRKYVENFDFDIDIYGTPYTYGGFEYRALI